jgi:hypothetical protein
VSARAATLGLGLASAGCSAPAAPPVSAPIANVSAAPAPVSVDETPMWIQQDGVITPLPPGRSTLTLAAAPLEIGWWALQDAGGEYVALRAYGATSAAVSAAIVDDAPTAGTWFESGHGFAQAILPEAPELPIDMEGFAYLYWSGPDDRRAELVQRDDERAQLTWLVYEAWRGTADAEVPIGALAGSRLELALFADQDGDDRFDHGEWAVVELAFR